MSDGRSCQGKLFLFELNDGCKSLYINGPGSFSCACEQGYLLMPDGRSCQGKNIYTRCLCSCSDGSELIKLVVENDNMLGKASHLIIFLNSILMNVPSERRL